MIKIKNFFCWFMFFVSTVLFALTTEFWLAVGGRFMIGLGAAGGINDQRWIRNVT